MLTILPQSTFRQIPWKNGGGVTNDVLLEPPGASHEDFDLRVSIAPITAEGPFSSYPGIERTITVLGANPLRLIFEGGAQDMLLERLRPATFDSVLAPHSRLPDGPTRVINVMTRGPDLSAEVSVVTGGEERSFLLRKGERAVLYAVEGSWTVRSDAPGVVLPAGDGCLAEGPSEILPACSSAQGRLLAAILRSGPRRG
jgi:environmental stress-induced protein Ves